MKKYVAFAIFLTLAGLGFRLLLAVHFPTDEPDDGRLYARIATNILQHHSYSIETEEPYPPTLIRVPGYPLFIAGLYSIFGQDNNRSVRVVQAVLDTLTCWFMALLALAWAPSDWSRNKRRRLLLIALCLAMCCPFPAIYVATILTETCTTLLATFLALSATLAIKARTNAKAAWWWTLAGFSGGLATMFRPDSGLFVAAAGFTLVLVGMSRAISQWRRPSAGPNEPHDGGVPRVVFRTLGLGVMLSIGFAIALGPWTVRNARVFGLFQPIAPSQTNMPGEFVPRGFIQWLKTWVDDVKYTETVEWRLDSLPIHIEQMPAYAFDSPEERDQIASLLERYNNPPSATPPPPAATPPPPAADTTPPSANPDSEKKKEVVAEPDTSDEEPADETETPDEEEDPPDEPDESNQAVEMTPEVDEGFAEIARAKIARHPLRFYFVVPLKRGSSLWFDTHSQYYPFQGELLPLASLDSDLRQQYWLPLFIFLTFLYTFLCLGGLWIMWKHKELRGCLLLFGLLIIPRFAFLTTMENPEPRYVVEFFAFVVAAGSLSMTDLSGRLTRRLSGLLRRTQQKSV